MYARLLAATQGFILALLFCLGFAIVVGKNCSTPCRRRQRFGTSLLTPFAVLRCCMRRSMKLRGTLRVFWRRSRRVCFLERHLLYYRLWLADENARQLLAAAATQVRHSQATEVVNQIYSAFKFTLSLHEPAQVVLCLPVSEQSTK